MEKRVDKQQVTVEGIQSSINRDCSFILEAIRRLKEGTWFLMHEDSDWVDFLLPKINAALRDHIEYEDLCVFPGLPKDLVKEHSAEHQKILTLLWTLEQSKQEKDAERFHSLLDLLVAVLDLHHKQFGCHLPLNDNCDDECSKERIIKRAEGSSLEC